MGSACHAGLRLGTEGSLRVCDAPPQTVALDDAHPFLPDAACLATVGSRAECVGQVRRLGRNSAAEVLALPALNDTTHLGIALQVITLGVEEVLTTLTALAKRSFLLVQLSESGVPVRDPGHGRRERWFRATPSSSRGSLLRSAVLRVTQTFLESAAHAGKVGQLAVWAPGRGAKPVGDGFPIRIELTKRAGRQAELAGRVDCEILGSRAVHGAGHFG